MDKYLLIQYAPWGDLGAFNCLVLICQDLVFQHAVWMLGDPEAADDVTQETFLLAYRTFRSFQDGDFSCRLLKIAHRLCMEELRKQEQDHPSLEKASNKSGGEMGDGFQGTGLVGLPEDNAYLSDLDKIIREILCKLSTDLRAALILVDIQGMDYPQTAEILGISEGSVKSHLARARGQIRDGLFVPAITSEGNKRLKRQT